MINLINEVEKLQKAAGILKEAPIMPPAAPAKDVRRSDVKAYDKSQSQATNIRGKAKQISDAIEFGQAFEVWVKTLGMDPKRFNKANLRREMEKVLTNLGYK
jgi:hypothetical protein